MFRVIVSGSRGFNNYSLLKSVLDNLVSLVDDQIVILSGKSRGADSLGEVYASRNNIRVISYPADWNNLGKSAGFIRNVEMARNADALVAFWDGESRGTAHMISEANRFGLRVKVVNYTSG